MTAVSAPKLLESVVEVTREKDRALLREGLIQTIQELLPTGFAGFSPLGEAQADGGLQVQGQFRGPLAPELSEALAGWPAERIERLHSGTAQTINDPQGNWLLHVEPICPRSDEPEMLTVLLRSQEPDNVRIVSALTRLYSNFLDVIHESERDRLTSLFNRRAFDTRLSSLIDHLQRGHPPPSRSGAAPGGRWWLALVDVDHFKRINDNFGHLYGDEVLLLLARTLQQCFRGEDHCFRYGGEEFAVILSRADAAGAAVALERLRGRVEQTRFPQVGVVTVSIGYTSVDGANASADLVDRADKALYWAKRAGRNRLAYFEYLLEQGEVEVARPSGDIELF